jgi:hypothetical protein
MLDIVPVQALQGKPVGIVAMGGSPHYYLAADTELRQVLAWFGALLAPTCVYLTGSEFQEGRLISESSRRDLAALVETLIQLWVLLRPVGLPAAAVERARRPLELRRNEFNPALRRLHRTLDRYLVPKYVEHRATPVHSFGQFFVALDRFRTTERDLDAHCPETGANLIIDAEEAAHIEVALDRISTVSNLIPRCVAQNR